MKLLNLFFKRRRVYLRIKVFGVEKKIPKISVPRFNQDFQVISLLRHELEKLFDSTSYPVYTLPGSSDNLFGIGGLSRDFIVLISPSIVKAEADSEEVDLVEISLSSLNDMPECEFMKFPPRRRSFIFSSSFWNLIVALDGKVKWRYWIFSLINYMFVRDWPWFGGILVREGKGKYKVLAVAEVPYGLRKGESFLSFKRRE